MPDDNHAHVLREDPIRAGMLYLGTERGLYLSYDDGASWLPMRSNLPTVAIHDIVVRGNSLVLGTNGRSIWMFDDVNLLREHQPAQLESAIHLYQVAPATQWRANFGATLAPGPNPRIGATISYRLKSKLDGELKVEIINDKNVVVRTFSSKPKKDGGSAGDDDDDASNKDDDGGELKTKPGLHQLVWDFQADEGKAIPGAKIDAGDPTASIRMLPGNYQVKLTHKQTTLTQPLPVVQDPRLTVPAADLAAQNQLALAMKADFDRLRLMVLKLRAIKRQLGVHGDLAKHVANSEAVGKSIKELTQKVDAVEEILHNPRLRWFTISWLPRVVQRSTHGWACSIHRSLMVMAPQRKG